MNKRDARRKSGRTKRLPAAALALCLLFTTYPDILEVSSVFAAGTQNEDDTVYVTGFASLPEEVREQIVPVGTGADELSLPDALEAFAMAEADNKEESTEAAGNGEGTTESATEPLPEETASPEPLPEETASAEPLPEETASPEPLPEETASPEPLPEETASPEPIPEATASPEPLPEATASPEPLPEETASPEPLPEETASPEPLPEESVSPEPLPEVSVSTVTMPEYQAENLVTVETLENTKETGAKEETVVIEGVTWQPEPEYDGNTAGTYLFTAVLPEGYVLKEGVSLPEITVTVVETAENMEATDGGKIALLMRAFDEDNSSGMVYYPEGSFDSYSWEIWTGEEWQEIGVYEPELVVGKEEWYTHRFRCVAKRDGVTYTARAKDDWQTGNMGAMLMAVARAAGEQTGDFMYYNNNYDYNGNGNCRFNIKGIDNGTQILTTYSDNGYRTASEVGGSKVEWNSNANMAMGNSLYGAREISLAYNGRYAKIQYTVTNKGSSSQEFKLGSCADVKIHDNDYAPISGNDNGLYMHGGSKNDYEFNLVAPSANGLWYGRYNYAYDNIFNNIEDRSKESTEDSGMAWSWHDTVAPGETWTRYVLLGVGELPDPPKTPILNIPGLEPGVKTKFTGTGATPGSTVVIEVDGQEYSCIANSSGTFEVDVTPSKYLSDGQIDVKYYAVSAFGGITNVQTAKATVTTRPSIALSDMKTTVAEDDKLTDTWYRSFVRSHNGTVGYNADRVKVSKPGTYTVDYWSSKTGYQNATATLTIEVLPLPLEVDIATATKVSGTTYTLSSSLKHIGKEGISETGFVWGIMQNPTVSLNNGKKATTNPATSKGQTFSLTADNIAEGVTYYVRAYAKSGGNVYYGEQCSFSTNGKNYGTFTIKNNGDRTFTVTRSGGADETQTVYFRTVNGSAVGGTHFDHKAEKLTFAQGDTSETITITEHAVTTIYGGDNATAYSNANRTYQVEIYRVDGGGTLGTTTSATRTMAKDAGHTVDRNCFVKKEEMKHSGELTSKTESTVAENSPSYTTVFTMDRYHTKYVPYLKETAHKYEMHMNAWFYEYEDGWEYLRFKSGSQTAVAKFEIDPNGNCREWVNGWIPGINGVGEYEGIIKSTQFSGVPYYWSTVENTPVLGFDINTSSIEVAMATTGEGANDWQMKECKQGAWYSDIVEPQVIGIAPMANSTYRVGDKITISLVFDEIVDQTNSSLDANSYITIKNWGNTQFKYAGGVNTNVLYFTGTVPATATGRIEVSNFACAGQIKDMCHNSGGTAAGGASGKSVSVKVDPNVPKVTITNAKTATQSATATIEAKNFNKLQYKWTQSKTLPVTGWFTVANTETATATISQEVGSRLKAGTWYLHVLATYTATGKTTHVYHEFKVPAPPSSGGGGGSTIVLPELALSVDNRNWATQRTINVVTKTPSDGNLTVKKMPSGSEIPVTGNSYTVTENGSYRFTLTAGGETVVKNVTVSKIDRTAPGAVINGPAVLKQNENVTLTVTPSDSGGSGIKDVAGVTGTWIIDGSTTTVKATQKDNGNGTYSFTTPGNNGNQNTYKLSVTVTDNAGNSYTIDSAAYTVNLRVPKVTVTRTDTNSQKGDTYSYTVNPNGNTITSVQLPDGTTTKTTSGTFKLTAKGTYYVIVTDLAGHVVRSLPMEVGDVDGDAPKVRLNQQNTNWTNGSVTLDVSIYEKSGIASAQWKKDGAVLRDLNYSGKAPTYRGSFNVTENGTYTVTVKDGMGNIGEDSITVSNIDKTAPTVTCTDVGTKNAATGWYTGSSVSVKLDFADNAGSEGGVPSGIKSVEYKLVSDRTIPTGGLTPLSKQEVGNSPYTYTINGNGKYYLYYIVTDKTGNVTDGFSNLIQKDSYAGAATITGPTEGQSVSKGLTMNINLTYGPGGGTLYAGSDKSNTPLGTMAGYGGMNAENSSITKNYEVKAAGSYYFRYHKKASGADKDWNFYVRQITFDSQGGSAVGSQLVWHDDTNAIRCKVVKPADPARTGYTFGGWYTNAECTENKKFKFDTQLQANTTLYAKWTANQYTLTFDYQGATGGETETSKTVTYDSPYGNLPVPTRTGYTFMGWYMAASGGTKVTSTTTVNTTCNHTLYAHWEDKTAPRVPVLQDGETLPESWTRTQKTIPLALYDGVGVTELWVSVDRGGYTSVSDLPSGAVNKQYTYTVMEGNHTYRFKAKDAAGNTSAESVEFRIKLDTAKPVIGEVTCENEVTNIWNWIIGKESLLITVLVTDTVRDVNERSGITQISYTLTPTGGSAKQAKIAEVIDGKATIIVSDDFKGTIAINCSDEAGNAADGKTIGASDGGVIVEDNAPAISILADRSPADTEGQPGSKVALSDKYYMSAPALTVTVKDDAQNAVTAGIASASYRIGETEYPVSVGMSALQGQVQFTIPANKIPEGINTITIETADNAGNTATETIMVRVKEPVEKPAAKISYQTEKLTELLPEEKYSVAYTDDNGTTHTEEFTAQNGEISLKEEWIGRQLSIVHKCKSEDTKDSEAQELAIPPRPTAPAIPKLDTRTDSSITLKKIERAQYRINGGDWQTGTEFTGLEEKTKYTFSAYYPATDTTFASLPSDGIKIVTMPKPPAGDTFLIDYVEETFALTEGVEAFTDATCSTSIAPDSLTDHIGQSIYIRYAEKGDIPAGMIKEVQILARPSAPELETVNASYPGAQDGKVTGLTEGIAYEIRVKTGDTWGEWTDAILTGTEIKNLPAGKYEVRVKAVEGKNFTGEAAAVTVDETPATVEETPEIEIDYSQETLKGFKPGVEYTITVDGEPETITAEPGGSLKLKEEWLGGAISVVHNGNGKDRADSVAQKFTIPARPDAPPAIPEIAERTDSSITLKEIEGAQYRIQGGEWQDSPVFTGLSEKTEYTFEVTYPAEDDAFTSKESGAAVITLPSAPKETAAEIDYQKEIFTLPEGVEAFADETCTTPITSDSLTNHIGQTIYIRYAADDDIPAGMIKEVQIPSRPSAPAASTVNASYPGAEDGTVTGLTAGIAYEIRVKSGDNWGEWTEAVLTGTEIKNLSAGKYEVRVKTAEGKNFTGETVAVTVDETPAIAEETPEIEIDYRQETLKGFIPGEKYTITVNGKQETITAEPDGSLKLKEEWSGGTISVVRQGNGKDKEDSKAQEFTIPQRKTQAPSPSVIGESYPGAADGKLTGLEAYKEYQISADNGNTWKDVAADKNGEITGLARGSYIVRVKGTDTEFAGKSSEKVTVETIPESDDSDKPDGDSNKDPDDEKEDKTTENTPQSDNDMQDTKKPDAGTETERKEMQTIQAREDKGIITVSGGIIETGNITETSKPITSLSVGDGAVIVTVVCEEESYTAGMKDTAAVANAVLMPEQVQLVNDGETIEIRVDVKDISENVPEQDKEVIESGLTEYRKEMPDLTLGMHVDISMFVKVGEGDWNAVTSTDEPIEVVIGIPEELKGDGRKFYIIRSHDGVHTLLPDMDDNPDTITVGTNLFSAYSIAYDQTDKANVQTGESSAECGLCNICPTFLGICCFIWLAVIVAVFLLIGIVIWKKRKEKTK